jgi:hypothetical protein
MNKETSEFFENNSYVVIRNFIDASQASLLYGYAKVKVQRVAYMKEFDKESHRPEWDGDFGDIQVPSSYKCYGDPMMDNLLSLSLPFAESYVGRKLIPTYSYWRFYEKGDVLERHIDRKSCEISATLCLGYDVSDVDPNKYENYNWPMWVKSKSGEEYPVGLNPGDVIFYKGCELEHWREEFIGLNHAQVFLHYNTENSSNPNFLDGRKYLGIAKPDKK